MPAISFQSVSKTFLVGPAGRTTSLKALDDVSFDIEEGEFFGLLGPNGAGKTTLISILAGLSRASGGRVTVQGHDVQSGFAQARRRLGVVPQELVFDPFFNVTATARERAGRPSSMRCTSGRPCTAWPASWMASASTSSTWRPVCASAR